MTATAPSPPRLAPGPGAGSDAGPGATAAGIWRTWRVPILLVALIFAGATLIALLQPAAATNNYLDPASTGPAGARALADILTARGHQVITEHTPAGAASAARSAASTVVITSPGHFTARQLHTLANLPGDLVLVQPSQAALSVLAPGVALAYSVPVGATEPECGLAGTRLAGNADMGGEAYQIQHVLPGEQQCYPVAGLPTLVQYARGSGTVTILGSGRPLTNQSLAQLGNAALALNLLESSSRVVWLVPTEAIQASPGLANGRPRADRLIPLGAGLVALQVGLAVLLTALWRARRLGPVVAEQLPVVVRAAETTEGHARLYQSRRARGQAAAALRAATINRLSPSVGVPTSGPSQALTSALAARTGLSPEQVAAKLFGPAPANDAELVRLADELDALERQVRAQ